MDGKDSFDRDCVFVCALAGGIMRMQVFCVSVCVVIVCLSCVLVEKCPAVRMTAVWKLSLSR